MIAGTRYVVERETFAAIGGAIFLVAVVAGLIWGAVEGWLAL